MQINTETERDISHIEGEADSKSENDQYLNENHEINSKLDEGCLIEDDDVDDDEKNQ